MQPQLVVSRLNKSVRLWSGHQNREVTVEVDYQRVVSGRFTLLHIARLREASSSENAEAASRNHPEVRC